MTLHAALTSGGRSIPWTFVPKVSVTGPTDDPIEIIIDSTHHSRIEYTIRAKNPGIYKWHVVAREDREGKVIFQRERILTGAVWDPVTPWSPGRPSLGGPIRFTPFLAGGWVDPTRTDYQP